MGADEKDFQTLAASWDERLFNAAIAWWKKTGQALCNERHSKSRRMVVFRAMVKAL
jgi:hypothetical protein